MDVFGTVVNVTTLVGQIVIIYRHVAAMQSFGDAAGMSSARSRLPLCLSQCGSVRLPGSH